MSTATAATQKNLPSEQDTSRPFTFERHDFGAYCYDTLGCKVSYSGRTIVEDDEAVARPSSASVGANYLNNLKAGHLGLKNFPAPAVVTWKSKDGVSHKAEVDIAEIFKDEVIRHNVAKEDLPTATIATTDEPEIILVINDRTIQVYMRATVYLKDTPERKRARRDEMILAFSKTY